MTRPPRPPRYGWAAQPLDPGHVTVPRPARWRPTEGETVLYRPPGRGLHRKLRGVVLAVTPGWASIRPARGAVLTLPWRHLRCLPPAPRRPVAQLVPAPPRAPVPLRARLPVLADANFYPQPKPLPPLRSRAYLRWIRTLPCCTCERLPPSQAHHYGPRGVSQRADDRRTVPLCATCHALFHVLGTLPGYPTPEAARAFLIATELDLVLAYQDRSRGGCP